MTALVFIMLMQELAQVDISGFGCSGPDPSKQHAAGSGSAAHANSSSISPNEGRTHRQHHNSSEKQSNDPTLPSRFTLSQPQTN